MREHVREHVRERTADGAVRAAVSVDICVIGGGPAGATLATRAAQLGLSVVLIERSAFPRAHLGESLTPGVRRLLASFGAEEAVHAAGGTPVERVWTTWDGTLAERLEPRAEGCLVDRGRFDEALLVLARQSGVRVEQPATLHARAETADGWRLEVATANGTHVVHARVLVDATGRSATLPGARRAAGPRTTALYAYWHGASRPMAPRIDAGADAWYWGVPLPDGQYNTLAFVDTDWLRDALRTTGGATARRRLDHCFDALLAASGLAPACASLRRRGPVRAAEATPYVDEAAATPASLKVGDAALALDPLSSSGVQKALQTALAGAIVVNTLVRHPERASLAIAFYHRLLTDASARHARWAAMHYATVAARTPTPFWTTRAHRAAAGTASDDAPTPTPSLTPLDRRTVRERMASARPLTTSPALRIASVPTLGAAFVESGDALQHPALDGPVAYLGDIALAPLLRDVPTGAAPMALARRWARTMPIERAVTVTAWMLQHGLLVEAPGATT